MSLYSNIGFKTHFRYSRLYALIIDFSWIHSSNVLRHMPSNIHRRRRIVICPVDLCWIKKLTVNRALEAEALIITRINDADLSRIEFPLLCKQAYDYRRLVGYAIKHELRTSRSLSRARHVLVDSDCSSSSSVTLCPWPDTHPPLTGFSWMYNRGAWHTLFADRVRKRTAGRELPERRRRLGVMGPVGIYVENRRGRPPHERKVCNFDLDD